MRCKIVVSICLGCCLFPLVSYSRSVTFYSDGALVELEASASRAVVEIPLPPDMIEDSLRIKPLGSAELLQVEIISGRVEGSKKEKERDDLLELKSRLLDRLKALETREQIFAAAAKSQSGKAPRKTKTNPEPLQSIRQGTDFAITQLEAVYTARRRTEQELKRVEVKIAEARRAGTVDGKVARVVLGSQRGTVQARYVVQGVNWIPRYDLRVSATDSARVDLLAATPGGFSGYSRYASLSSRIEGGTLFPVQAGSNAALLGRFTMPVSQLFFGSAGQARFSFVLKNNEKLYLPPGEATVYHRGEYMGKVRFEGLSSGRSRTVTGGR